MVSESPTDRGRFDISTGTAMGQRYKKIAFTEMPVGLKGYRGMLPVIS